MGAYAVASNTPTTLTFLAPVTDYPGLIVSAGTGVYALGYHNGVDVTDVGGLAGLPPGRKYALAARHPESGACSSDGWIKTTASLAGATIQPSAGYGELRAASIIRQPVPRARRGLGAGLGEVGPGGAVVAVQTLPGRHPRHLSRGGDAV